MATKGIKNMQILIYVKHNKNNLKSLTFSPPYKHTPTHTLSLTLDPDIFTGNFFQLYIETSMKQ